MTPSSTTTLRKPFFARSDGLLLALFLTAGMSSLCQAAPLPKWSDETYKYITINQSVGDALIELGRNVGVPVKLSTSVKGRMTRGLPIGNARRFLDAVCRRYGLVWYYDGSVLNISAETESRTEMFKLDETTIGDVTERLDRIGVSDARFPVRVSEADRVVSTSGPPSYLALVKKTLGVISGEDANTTRSAAQVRVFRGRRAELQEVPTKKAQ